MDKLKTYVLAIENLEQLVKIVAEEMDAASIQRREHLDALRAKQPM